MNTIIDADSAKLAGLQIDLLQKVRQGHVTLDHILWFNGLSKEMRDSLMAAGLAPKLVSPVMFKTPDTDLDWWLDQTQKFAKKHLGVTIYLRERFVIPTELPWNSVIPVFDPGFLTNRGMVEKALQGLGLKVYEETDVMKYSGSEAYAQPTLHFIENSVKPNADTMGKSPDDLLKTGKSYLRLRGYGLAMGLYNFAKRGYLDDKETWTWFPDDRLPDGNVALGRWRPGGAEVRFLWGDSGDRDSTCGARVAITLKPRS